MAELLGTSIGRERRLEQWAAADLLSAASRDQCAPETSPRGATVIPRILREESREVSGAAGVAGAGAPSPSGIAARTPGTGAGRGSGARNGSPPRALRSVQPGVAGSAIPPLPSSGSSEFVLVGLALVGAALLLTPLLRRVIAGHPLAHAPTLAPASTLTRAPTPTPTPEPKPTAETAHAAPESDPDPDSEPEDELTGYARADRKGDPAGAFMLGSLLRERGDLEGAIAAFRRAAGRGHVAAAANLGVLLEQRGDLDGALQAYLYATEQGDARAAFNLGAFLAERGELSGAVSAFRIAEQRGDGEIVTDARSALDQLQAWRET